MNYYRYPRSTSNCSRQFVRRASTAGSLGDYCFRPRSAGWSSRSRRKSDVKRRRGAAHPSRPHVWRHSTRWHPYSHSTPAASRHHYAPRNFHFNEERATRYTANSTSSIDCPKTYGTANFRHAHPSSHACLSRPTCSRLPLTSRNPINSQRACQRRLAANSHQFPNSSNSIGARVTQEWQQ